MDVIKAMQEYVDALFESKMAEYRFDPVAIETTFQRWGETYLENYDTYDPVLHTTFRQFLLALDKNYSYQISHAADDILNRVKWVSPIPAGTGTEGERYVACAVGNLVLTGLGVKPAITDKSPLDAGYNLNSHIIEGMFAYNSTDDRFYYRQGDSIKDLHWAVDEAIAGVASDLSTLTGDVEGIATTVGNHTSAILALESHVQDVGIHRLPDGDTIVVNNEGKLEAVQADLSSILQSISVLEGNYASLAMTISTIEQSIIDLQNALNLLQQQFDDFEVQGIDTSNFVLKNPEPATSQTIRGTLLVENNIVGYKNVTAYGGARV